MADDPKNDPKIHILHPTKWMAPDWLPTGEALLHEWMARHGSNFKFLDDEGTWYIWTNRCWERDQLRRANVLAGELCCEIGRTKKKSMRMKLEATRTVLSVTQRARDECALPIDTFDHHSSINAPSGEWSGRDKVEEHDRDHLHSKLTAVHGPVLGDPVAWLRHLKRVTGGDVELTKYLQRFAGYCCSASTVEECLFFFYGTGQNGKSVFIKTVANILGSYAATASIETFLASKYDRHPEELAGFRGVRMVVASEADKGRVWNEQLLKQATGGEKIRARFMRQNSFEYTPLFKLAISGNHKPQLHTTDKAIRRRFHIIPFTIQIPEADRVLGYGDKLIEEWPQIFGWMLQGLDEWHRIGLAPPESVVAATDAYMAAQDIKADWIDECCDMLPDAVTPVADLYGNWRAYAEARGEFVGSVKLFSEDLQGRGFMAHRTNAARCFKGIMVKPAMQGQHSFRYGD